MPASAPMTVGRAHMTSPAPPSLLPTIPTLNPHSIWAPPGLRGEPFGPELLYDDQDDTPDPARLRTERDAWRRLAMFADTEHACAQAELRCIRSTPSQLSEMHDLKLQLDRLELERDELQLQQDELKAQTLAQMRQLKAAHATDLRKAKAQHDAALDAANADVAELVAAQRNRNRKRWDASSGAVRRLEGELCRHARVIGALSLTVQHQSAYEQSIQALESELANVYEELDKRSARLAAAEFDLEVACGDLTATRAELIDTRAELSAVQSELQQQADTPNKQHEELQAAKALLERSEADLAAARAELDDVRDELEVARGATNTDVSTDPMTAAEELVTIDTLTADLTLARTELSEAQSSITTLTADLAAVQTKLASHVVELAVSKDTCAAVQQGLKGARDDLRGSKRELEVTQSQLKQMQVRLVEAQAELEETRTFQSVPVPAPVPVPVVELQNGLKQARRDLKAARKELAQTVWELECARAEGGTDAVLVSSVERERELVVALAVAVLAVAPKSLLRSQPRARRRSSYVETARLEMECEALREQVEDLQRAAQLAVDGVFGGSDDVQALHIQLAEHEARATRRDVSIASLSSELVQVASQLDELTTERDTLFASAQQTVSLNNHIASLKMHIKQLEGKVDKLGRQVVEERARVGRRNDQILTHQREVARLQTNGALAEEALEELEEMRKVQVGLIEDANEVREARDTALLRIQELEDRLANNGDASRADISGVWSARAQLEDDNGDRDVSFQSDEGVILTKDTTPRAILPRRSSAASSDSRDQHNVSIFDFAAAAADSRRVGLSQDGAETSDEVAEIDTLDMRGRRVSVRRLTASRNVSQRDGLDASFDTDDTSCPPSDDDVSGGVSSSRKSLQLHPQIYISAAQQSMTSTLDLAAQVREMQHDMGLVSESEDESLVSEQLALLHSRLDKSKPALALEPAHAPTASNLGLPVFTPSSARAGVTPSRSGGLGLATDEEEEVTPVARGRVGAATDDTMNFVLAGGRGQHTSTVVVHRRESAPILTDSGIPPTSRVPRPRAPGPGSRRHSEMPFSAIDIQPASEYGHSKVSQDSNAMLSGKNQRIMFNIPGLRAADVQALVDRVKTLEAELARRPASSDDTDVVALQAELAQTSQELDRLRIDYDALVTDLQNIEFELDASAASVETLTVQLDKTEQELADVKGELVNSQHAGEALRERVEKLERGRREDVSRRSKEYMSRVSDTKSLREELDEAHESLASVRADLEKSKRRTEDVSALQVERDATRAQLLDREGEVAAMVGVILDLKAQISGERPAPGRSTSKMYLRDLSIVSEEDETGLWKVSALERDVSDLRVQLSESRERAKMAERELNETKGVLLDARAQMLRQELALSEKTVPATDHEKLDGRIAVFEATLAAKESELDAARNELASTHSNLLAAEGNLAIAQTSLTKARAALDEQLNLANTLADKLRASREVLEKERQYSRRKIVKLEIEIDDLTEEREAQKERATAFEQERDDPLAKLQQLEEDVSRLEDVQQRLQEIDQLQLHVQSSAQLLSIAKSEASDLQKKLDAAAATHNVDKSQKVTLERRIRELEREVSDKDEIERNVRSLQKELAAVSAERDEIENQLGEMDDECVAQRQTLLEKNNEIASLSGRLHRAELEMLEMKDSRTRASELQGRLDVMDAELKNKYEECEELDERVVGLMKEKRRVEGRADLLARKVQGLESILDNIRGQQSATPQPAVIAKDGILSRPTVDAMAAGQRSQPRLTTMPTGPAPVKSSADIVTSNSPVLTRGSSTTPTLTRPASRVATTMPTRPPSTDVQPRLTPPLIIQPSAPRSDADSVSGTRAPPVTSRVTSDTTSRAALTIGRVASSSRATLSRRSLSPGAEDAPVRASSPHTSLAAGARASSRAEGRPTNRRVAAALLTVPRVTPQSPRRPSVEAAAMRTDVKSMAAAITTATSMPNLPTVTSSAELRRLTSPAISSNPRKRSIPEDFDVSMIEGALPVAVPIPSTLVDPTHGIDEHAARPPSVSDGHLASRRPGSGFTPKRSTTRPVLVMPSPSHPKDRALGADLTNEAAAGSRRLVAGSRAVKRSASSSTETAPGAQNAFPLYSTGSGRVEAMRQRFQQ